MKKTASAGLMNVPLLQQFFNDPQVKAVPRANDSSWNYERYITLSVSGFNPYHRVVYYNENSSLGQWIKAGRKKDRLFNEGDCLAREALFLAHDYLHCWAVMLIQQEMPKLEYGFGKITEKTLEDYAFCHLLTEAIATVGLDYWYLSTIDLNEVCDLGSTLNTLTVAYHERDLPEFRKFNRSFKVQDPRWLKHLAEFYCNGTFPGFDVEDLRKSPKLFKWLQHELSYGETQRKYTRSWLHHLAGTKTLPDAKKLSEPIAINASWKKKIIEIACTELWEKVKKNKLHIFKNLPPIEASWKAPKDSSGNFRFTNVQAIGNDKLTERFPQTWDDVHFRLFFSQCLSTVKYKTFPKELFPMLNMIREKKDAKSLLVLLKDPRIERMSTAKKPAEPADIFFLN